MSKQDFDTLVNNVAVARQAFHDRETALEEWGLQVVTIALRGLVSRLGAFQVWGADCTQVVFWDADRGAGLTKDMAVRLGAVFNRRIFLSNAITYDNKANEYRCSFQIRFDPALRYKDDKEP